MATGKIGVTTENIFPVIKKFLYSDHEIFLRELVSNAIDATQKLKTLSSFGEFKGELGEMNVKVSVDKEKGTLTVSDHGIGMDAEDVDRYINQIAFSGAEEFLEKYKDNANSIIGHLLGEPLRRLPPLRKKHLNLLSEMLALSAHTRYIPGLSAKLPPH